MYLLSLGPTPKNSLFLGVGPRLVPAVLVDMGLGQVVTMIRLSVTILTGEGGGCPLLMRSITIFQVVLVLYQYQIFCFKIFKTSFHQTLESEFETDFYKSPINKCVTYMV